jgi:predicted nucleic acid-binding protein
VALTYLLDTSVVTRVRVPAVADRVRELDRFGLGRAGITDLEIGYSARGGDEWDDLVGALDVFRRLELDDQHLRRASQVQRLLAARGLKGRKVPDLLVAAIAEAASLTVLHYDADFDRIASVTHQPTEWIVPPGSVD